MGRPTPDETNEMKYRKLLKEVWEKDFNRIKSELTCISFDKQFMTIKTVDNKETNIHRSLFEDYFAAVAEELKSTRMERIKRYMKQIL